MGGKGGHGSGEEGEEAWTEGMRAGKGARIGAPQDAALPYSACASSRPRRPSHAQQHVQPPVAWQAGRRQAGEEDEEEVGVVPRSPAAVALDAQELRIKQSIRRLEVTLQVFSLPFSRPCP